MVTSVQFWSRAKAVRLVGSSEAGMISITNSDISPADLNPGWGSVLRLAFDDVVPGGAPSGASQLMTLDQATEIVTWVAEHCNSLEAIHVHCEAGQSRSAAVARFIGETLGLDIDEADVRFANHHVYNLLRQAGADDYP